MKKIILIIAFWIASFSTFATKYNRYHKIANVQQRQLSISTFSGKEENEVQGCSGVFYKSMADKKSGKYLATSDLGSMAFIKINNRLEKFAQVKYLRNKRESVWLFKSISNSIQLKIEIKTSKAESDESALVTGIITVETKDGKKSIIPFVGNTGC